MTTGCLLAGAKCGLGLVAMGGPGSMTGCLLEGSRAQPGCSWQTSEFYQRRSTECKSQFHWKIILSPKTLLQPHNAHILLTCIFRSEILCNVSSNTSPTESASFFLKQSTDQIQQASFWHPSMSRKELKTFFLQFHINLKITPPPLITYTLFEYQIEGIE